MASTHWTPDNIGDQAGRTALITGGNSGIGLETARQLARHGMRVILAGRSQARLDEAARALRAEQPAAALDTLVLDLGDLSSIQDAAAIAASEPLDLLVNNAGIMNVPKRETTTDGFERTFGTNHLGHFALTAQLMPALRRAPAARVITVGALAAGWRGGELTDLNSEESYKPSAAYARSKRANTVFSVELARRLAGAGSPVKAISVHPGTALTGLQRNFTGPAARVLTVVADKLIMGSLEGAAWPSLYAATSPAVENGSYLGPAGRRQDTGTPIPATLPPGADDPAAGAKLWVDSEWLTGVTFEV
jgi:NAD(P)-dependent dehydrogenase (short-subunit alcohol dehydrogenase family)